MSKYIYKLKASRAPRERVAVTTRAQWEREHHKPLTMKDHVMIDKPISKHVAKHDRKAARAYRMDGIKPASVPDRGLFAMGLVHRNFSPR